MSHPLIKVYLSDVHDPWWNQAVEDQLFNTMDPSAKILFLWRNRPSVVIGRFQNPWLECHLPHMKQDGICLVRRKSGGGTVFHDLGNLNFSFLLGKESFDRQKNLQVVMRALYSLGIPVSLNHRFDLIVENKKISGSAFKVVREKGLHHGTLLVQADLLGLKKYLLPTKQDLISKGISSVRSQVTNLRDFSSSLCPMTLARILTQEFFKEYDQKGEVEVINEVNWNLSEATLDLYREWQEWEWCFGETPRFQQYFQKTFSWGDVEGELLSLKGRIAKLVLRNKDQSLTNWEPLCQNMQGAPYGHPQVHEVWRDSCAILGKPCAQIAEMSSWILGEIS